MRWFRTDRHFAAFITAAVLIATAAWIAGPASLAGEGANTPLLGKQIADFKLADFNGKDHSLSQYGSGKGVVLIFVSTRCPVSNAYNERMVQLAADYQPKGFQLLGINANKPEDPAEMASHAQKNGWNFPVLKDAGNVLADRLGASVTPEVYVIDGDGMLRYHGRIDDSQDPAGIKSQDLKAALDAILARQEIAKKESKAFGCSIKRG